MRRDQCEDLALIIIIALLCVLVWKPARAQLFPSLPPPPAPAQVPLHLPPVEYDQPYKGKLTIETVTPEQLRARCFNATLRSLACAFPGRNDCHILMLNEGYIKSAGWTVELMLRHERAHCNGWPQYHPDKRPL